MSNAAGELLEIFRRWQGGKSAASSRTGLGAASLEGEREHVRAMMLIHELWVQLDVLEAEGTPTHVFRQASAKWVHIVLAYPRNWGVVAEHNALYGEGRLDMLQALVIVLSGRPNRVNVAGAADLDDFLAAIIDLLSEDDALDDALRAYIAKLVSEVRRASDTYKATGEFDAEEALTQLWVAMLAAEAQSGDKKSQWRNFADRMKVPVASGMLIGLPALAIETLKLATGA